MNITAVPNQPIGIAPPERRNRPEAPVSDPQDSVDRSGGFSWGGVWRPERAAQSPVTSAERWPRRALAWSAEG